MNSNWRILAVLASLVALLNPLAEAARQSKIKDTKHNLSTSSAVGNTKADSETQICVFCHTPHGANTANVSPLWNRASSSATYTPYSSESLDAKSAQSGWTGQPLGSSKLCLSCHDGTIALGNVVNAPGSGLGSAISVSSSTTTVMPAGAAGATSGYTRRLGNDLSNDHPISITYDSTLATRDGELRVPDGQQRITGGSMTINTSHPLVGPRATGQGSGIGSSTAGTGLYGSSSTRPVLPLENTFGAGSGTGQIQCTTCHDPHIKESTLAPNDGDAADITKERNIKFLRRPRFQMAQPTQNYSDGNDIICLACHDKGLQGNSKSWAYSAHANSAVATQTYLNAAADTREFPRGMPVWKVSCLNCHDTHTVQGARRLTRSGGDGSVSTLEETCYQCHRDSVSSIITPTAKVPNIRDDFQLTYKMPITGTEVHDIGGNFNDGYAGGAGTTGSDCSGTGNKCGADFVERVSLLASRHAECTDCHNPHRVVKFRLFSGKSTFPGDITQTPDTEGTHPHTDSASGHTNVASGVLRGTWGVEPSYTGNSFHNRATNFTVRRGDPGADSVPNTSTPDTKPYVTREYQVCLKCHSSYAYGTTPPSSGTSIGQNGLTQYTDQAKEFHAPSAHADEPLSLGNDGGAAGYDAGNHRSWHPVMRQTGRTATKRNITADSAFNHPFRDVGTQTMYCSDCHGSGTAGGTVIPAGANQATGEGSPWGPHGSNNAFILKGQWNNDSTDAATTLCLRCHNPTSSSGFSGGGKGNLHDYHKTKVGELQCTWCHIAVPHGWKNRSLLVNLNDVGGEVAGLAATDSKEVNLDGMGHHYTNPPYYLEAKLKIRTFATSGSWSLGDCGSANKAAGNRINGMNGDYPGPYTNVTTNAASNGKNWMITDVCDSGLP
jgi:predicted CXXCH cytochrome family protein